MSGQEISAAGDERDSKSLGRDFGLTNPKSFLEERCVSSTEKKNVNLLKIYFGPYQCTCDIYSRISRMIRFHDTRLVVWRSPRDRFSSFVNVTVLVATICVLIVISHDWASK